MKQNTFSVNPAPNLVIESIPGDLRVAGWERAEIMVKTDGDQLKINPDSDPILVSCDEDLILYVPRGANVKIEKVAGDAILQALNGQISLGPVAGDLTMNDLGPVTLETIAGDASLRNIGALIAGSISGDFTLRGGHGTCVVDNVGGDGSIRDVDGMLTIENVGSDLYVRNVHGAVTVKAGADVAFYVSPKPGQIYDVNAGDDLVVRLAPDTNVKIHLNANSPKSIQVDFPGVKVPEDCSSCEIILGEQKEGMAEMLLTANGDLLVTSQADPWESVTDFDSGDWHIPPIPPIPPLPPDFSARINRRIQASMERAQVHIEAAGRKAEATGRKAEAAMRRAEMKARAAEVRGRRGTQFNVNVGRWNWDLSPKGPVETGETVSDDERLIILRMLQEKKISIAEAENLLAALEGK
jgi:hypothetical protein